MNPRKQYHQMLQRSEFSYDAGQEAVVGHLDRVYRELLARPEKLSLMQKMLGANRVQGLYVYGGVGRGKTYLMDLFYNSIRGRRRLRLHFHRFMQKIHHMLKEQTGKRNPLKRVAAEVAAGAEVICFDDFFVEDIGDAMLLGGLFRELLKRGVVLVITSNIHPDNLYKDGLQRSRFLPAIEFLKQYCTVVEMADGTDYRLTTLKNNRLYHCPADETAERHMEREFALLAPETGSHGEMIEIEGRELWTRRKSDDVVWFNFSDLCEGPRSQHDYLQLALEFHAILLSGVPQFSDSMDAAARRFIYLIDVLYDHRVKVVVSAAAQPDELYVGERLQETFQRTTSRLVEMQSVEYLASPHRTQGGSIPADASPVDVAML